MLVTIAILTPILSGLILYTYKHPAKGRVLINYIFIILFILSFIVGIFSYGYWTGLIKAGTELSEKSSEYKEAKEYWYKFFLISSASCIGSILIWKGLHWLSYFFEKTPKSK